MLHSSIAKNISKRIYNINYNIIIAKYKLYTESHCGDIEEQEKVVEEKKLVPESQTSFRKEDRR